MNDLRTAAQQALEEIEEIADAITALRAALAQQAEPVAWLQPKTVDGHLRPDLGYETCSKDDYGAFPVNTAPPQRKPLTEEEKRALADKFLSCQPESYEVSGVFDLISAVERAHGIGEQP